MYIYYIYYIYTVYITYILFLFKQKHILCIYYLYIYIYYIYYIYTVNPKFENKNNQSFSPPTVTHQ